MSRKMNTLSPKEKKIYLKNGIKILNRNTKGKKKTRIEKEG
jgi:hypothetical protein